MSLLKITQDMANVLISHRLLSPVSHHSSEYELVIATDTEPITIRVEVEITIAEDTDKSFSLSDLREKFERFVDSHPPSDHFNNFPKTRTLKTDKGKKGQERFIRLIKEYNLTPAEVTAARDYEVYWRRKASIESDTQENKMTFMSGMDVWLNNPTNIKTQIQEMRNEGIYNKFIEGNSEDLQNIDNLLNRSIYDEA